MQVVLNTGRKNVHGLNGVTVAVKEIVDARVTVVVPQSILPEASRRGTAATRTLDFLPSDVQEFVGELTFPVDDAEVQAAAADRQPGPAPLFEGGNSEAEEAAASEDLTEENEQDPKNASRKPAGKKGQATE